MAVYRFLKNLAESPSVAVTAAKLDTLQMVTPANLAMDIIEERARVIDKFLAWSLVQHRLSSFSLALALSPLSLYLSLSISLSLSLSRSSLSRGQRANGYGEACLWPALNHTRLQPWTTRASSLELQGFRLRTRVARERERKMRGP